MMWVVGGVFVAVALTGLAVLLEITYRMGHARGYSKGMDEASGWRDEKIEQYRSMVIEALRQRDEARAARHNTPNPFAWKDVN